MKTFVILAVSLFLFLGSTQAQEKCDEQTIRAIGDHPVPQIASDDVYFDTGSASSPVIGRAELEQLRNKHLAERKNQQPTRFHTDRIVPSSATDMAYDYGTAHVSYEDAKTGRHVNYDIRYLRVWKVAEGKCRMAAAFSRPLDSAKVGE